MKFNRPSRTRPTVFIARIAFLITLLAGTVFVAPRVNLISSASNQASVTKLPGRDEENTSSSRYASTYRTSALAPPCTTDPIVVNNSDSGAGSLRQAIIDACDASNITFNMAMVTSPITLTTAELSINKNLTITGPGSSSLTVQRSSAGGTPGFRIFKINSGNTVSISGLTISNGQTPSSSGGGIWNELSVLNLHNCTVSGNSAVHGGGIFNNIGTLNVTNSTFIGNSAVNNGGGIVSDDNSTLDIANSTFSGNSANGGGAVVNDGVATFTNSTLTGNTAIGSGGGIFNQPNDQVSIRNSIIALNTTVTICGGNCPNGSPDLSGDFTSLGHNLIGKSDGSTGFTNVSNGDQVGSVASPLDPRLGPLANYGGPTQTHALLAGSTAIDAGNNCVLNNSCSPSLGFSLTTDQRDAGFARSTDGNGDGVATVDIGAYEVQSILVTNTSDNGAGSLRQAITDANVGADTNAINFQVGLTGTISLLSSLPDFSTSMLINGPGANQITVQRSAAGGTPDFRIFTINPGKTVGISGLTISNGHLSDRGGGISNYGNLTILNCTVSANTQVTGGWGGGIYNDTAATLNVTQSTITGNSAQDAGGIANFGALTVTNSTISGNTTSGGGGGIRSFSDSTLTVINSTISGNTAAADGGGIKSDGAATLNNTTISGNTAGSLGGGLFRSFPLAGATLTNVTITNNHGGGARLTGAKDKLRNTMVAGNFHGSTSTSDDISGEVDTSAASSNNLIGTGRLGRVNQRRQ